MSAAERQRRRRKKIARNASAEVRQAKAAKARDKAALDYIPTPPGITYWSAVSVRQADGSLKEIWAPTTKPLAVCENMLDDDDVMNLIGRLGSMARKRGLLNQAHEQLDRGAPLSGFMVWEAAKDESGASRSSDDTPDLFGA
jgi:hypothetical protein